MIVSVNSKPELSEFQALMSRIDLFLNQEATVNPAYFTGKNGTSLEKDIKFAADECAKNTKFEGTIELVSGASFPDIVAAKYYGIEVKSTKENHWTSIGSSILESTRIQDIERIFLTFGKLGKPIQFISRPYEECLSGIAVTHYPRYQIDMMLKSGETIFDKMGVSYESLRKMENPVKPVAEYYKSQLRPGQSLWWTGNQSEQVDNAAPALVRLWRSLSSYEKDEIEAKLYIYFPECILRRNNTKYDRATLWMATQCGVINPNLRDSFSAGGRELMRDTEGKSYEMPAIFRKIEEHIDLVKNVLFNISSENLFAFWQEPIRKNRVEQWIDLVIRETTDIKMKTTSSKVLRKIFFDRD